MATLPTGRKLLTRKAYDNSHDGFNETVKYKILHCSNMDGNNNKYYCIELQKNPTTRQLRLFSQYGRLGISEVFEIRDKWKEDKTILDFDQLELVEKEMESIVKKKLRGKTVKHGDESVKESYHVVDVSVPKVGSVNILGKDFGLKENVDGKKPKKKSTKSKIVVPANISRIITQSVEENVHNVTSATSIKYSNGRFETPLGPVTLDHIKKAKEPLDELKELLESKKSGDDVYDDVINANNLYFSLIPHTFGRKISTDDWINDNDKLSDEYDILEQLESAVNLGEEMTDEAGGILESLKLKFIETERKEYLRLRNKFEDSRAHNHNNLRDWTVKNIFELELNKERKNYTNRSIAGREVELFHGSRNCNILSIMSSGLIIPSVAAHGRMFGNGIYAAPSSTKALNYSTGFWGSGKNKYPNAFVFVVNFSLGREHNPRRSIWGGPPSGYDSVWANAREAGLYNDEVIVYSLEQCTITHIIELEKGR